MRMVVAADHAGYGLRGKVVVTLRDMGHDVEDLGVHDRAPVDYPDYAEKVAELSVHFRRGRSIYESGDSRRKEMAT